MTETDTLVPGVKSEMVNAFESLLSKVTGSLSFTVYVISYPKMIPLGFTGALQVMSTEVNSVLSSIFDTGPGTIKNVQHL